MIQRIAVLAVLVPSAILMAFSGRALQEQEKTPEVISFCQLLSRPDQYLGKEVTIRIRVKVFRHGTSISDDACPKNALLLKTNQSSEQKYSVSHFYQFLVQHRQSSKPIFATITGHLVRGSTSGFVLRRDFDFELDSVAEISEGNKVSVP